MSRMGRKDAGEAVSPGLAEAALREFLALAGEGAMGRQKGASALVKNLWYALQRHRAGLDWELSRRCQALRARERHLLWWAMLECYALCGLAPAVAVAVAAGYAKRRWGQASAGFINAVLRGLLRDHPDGRSFQDMLRREAPPAVACGLPEPLYQRWCRDHGVDWTQSMAALLMQDAPVCARRRGCFAGGRAGRPYPPGGVMASSTGDFDPSQYYLQDSSTLMAPFLLAPQPGENVADLCAAPGGKSLVISELLDGRGSLLAADRSESRLRQLHENLDGVPIAEIAQCDAAAPPGRLQGCFDAVLLDVPCSNTGVIRRRPDVRWGFSEARLAELLTLQRKILDGAAQTVKPGGRLVYSTCSIEPEENVRQVEAFVERHPDFTVAAAHQLHPTAFHDGGFAALLQAGGGR